MSVKINQLELENVKRIKAVKIELTENGLTVIGGRNNQGKTSVLDSIAWALGGDRFKPSQPKREGSVTPPNLKVTLSNGLIVERKGKNSSLKVTDPAGNKSGQQVLNSLIEELALNLPKFMNSTSQEKARTLLKIIGVGDQLFELEKKEQECYNERHSIGQIADRKKKFAEEQPYYQGVPNELVSASELIKQQQEILARNGENARKREKVNHYEYQVSSLTDEVSRIRQQLQVKEAQLNEATTNLSIAKTDAMDLHDESTAELESNIQEIDEINRKVRANMDKEKAEEDARDYERQYQELTKKVEDIRTQKMNLLQNADLPLPDLSVENNEITYKGQKWDNMSGSDQLKVATAIVRKLNPQCGFVLLDKLEQMDQLTLAEFGKWLEEQELQAIGTRVSTGNECSIIIEDGYVKGQNDTNPVSEENTNEVSTAQNAGHKVWEPGKF